MRAQRLLKNSCSRPRWLFASWMIPALILTWTHRRTTSRRSVFSSQADPSFKSIAFTLSRRDKFPMTPTESVRARSVAAFEDPRPGQETKVAPSSSRPTGAFGCPHPAITSPQPQVLFFLSSDKGGEGRGKEAYFVDCHRHSLRAGKEKQFRVSEATRFGWGRRIGLSLLFVALIASARAQTNLVPAKPVEVTEAYLREHYTKVEYKIPMRDGVRLFTSVYAPKDDSQPYPLL